MCVLSECSQEPGIETQKCSEENADAEVENLKAMVRNHHAEILAALPPKIKTWVGKGKKHPRRRVFRRPKHAPKKP